MKKMLFVLIPLALFLAGCVQPPVPPPPPPVGGLENVCSEQELRNYVVGYAGTDEALVQEFKDFCIELKIDSEGCPVDLSKSTFSADFPPQVFAECLTLCPDLTHGKQLFGVFYNSTDAGRDIVYLRAGIFQVQCD